MQVVRNGHEIIVDIRVEMLTRLSEVGPTLDNMVKVGNHAGRREPIPILVEVEAPRIANPVGEDFEFMLRGVIAPDARIDRITLGVGRPRLADARMREDAVTSIEPAIGSPGKAIERFVRILVAPAIEQDRRLAIRLVVAIAIREE